MGERVIIRAVKLRAVTNAGDYGFAFSFGRTLTVIKGANSSGKSTLVNCLLYGLGLEELIGGKGDGVLPYAVKDHFDFGGKQIDISASEILVELENRTGSVITVRRVIRDAIRDAKLVEIFVGACLTSGAEFASPTPTYLHDSGAARRNEGFHHFLEKFLGLELPTVPASVGGETKLYLQAVLAAIAVEQKRGWTDYIANIPFYGIRDARLRVVEYLLALDVFDTAAERNRLNLESVAIHQAWQRLADELRRLVAARGVLLEGVPSGPTSLFNEAAVQFFKAPEGAPIRLEQYITQLRQEHETIRSQANIYSATTSAQTIGAIEAAGEELRELSVLHERATSTLGIQRASLEELEKLLVGAREDLEKNKVAAKLRQLGATSNLHVASSQCPTCLQEIEDTLLRETVSGPQMDLESNIAYLDSQRRMLERQIAGLMENIRQSDAAASDAATRLSEKRDYVNALRADVSSGALESRALVRRQVQIEMEIEALQRMEVAASRLIQEMLIQTALLAKNQLARKRLPQHKYTQGDLARIAMFEKNFKANALMFGYKSAPVAEIQINDEALVPSLAQLELREIRTDIKSDSSASDFVRLIWSYLLGLYQTSSHPVLKGNHPGFLLFDEPGQHSMAVDSQHALLMALSRQTGLQSIVAASFDEAEAVFETAVSDVSYTLIKWEGKLIGPLDEIV